MTFKEWWKLLKPAECDEVQLQFEDCWIHAYQAGRDAMREEAVKVCGDFDIPDIVDDYVEGKRMAVAQIAYKIGTLK